MGKLAFLFPGQGSQKVGMGADLAEARPDVYARYLELAESASGLPIRTLSLEGPLESLTETSAAQPALFALSLAVAELAREAGLEPDFVAGHSLGEYTAAVAAGALSLEDGMRLVSLRGRLMAEIQAEQPGAMAAVIGLPAERVAELCEQASAQGIVAPANLNSPVQVVVSGEQPAVERLTALAREAGAEKVVRLQVGAAFHSELMKPVQERLAAEMEQMAWRDPEVPLASNASGRLVSSAEEVRRVLVAQIASPVRWVECLQALAAGGCETFLELGSARVLTGLTRQVLGPEVDAGAVDSPQKLRTFLEGHPQLAAAS